jgi:hypothetical protein
MKTYAYLWQYLVGFFLEWQILQTKVVEKIKTHIFCSITFSPKMAPLWDNVKENAVEPDRSQITIRRMRFVRWITKDTNAASVVYG